MLGLGQRRVGFKKKKSWDSGNENENEDGNGMKMKNEE